jgi:hypothetical protein
MKPGRVHWRSILWGMALWLKETPTGTRRGRLAAKAGARAERAVLQASAWWSSRQRKNGENGAVEKTAAIQKAVGPSISERGMVFRSARRMLREMAAGVAVFALVASLGWQASSWLAATVAAAKGETWTLVDTQAAWSQSEAARALAGGGIRLGRWRMQRSKDWFAEGGASAIGCYAAGACESRKWSLAEERRLLSGLPPSSSQALVGLAGVRGGSWAASRQLDPINAAVRCLFALAMGVTGGAWGVWVARGWRDGPLYGLSRSVLGIGLAALNPQMARLVVFSTAMFAIPLALNWGVGAAGSAAAVRGAWLAPSSPEVFAAWEGGRLGKKDAPIASGVFASERSWQSADAKSPRAEESHAAWARCAKARLCKKARWQDAVAAFWAVASEALVLLLAPFSLACATALLHIWLDKDNRRRLLAQERKMQDAVLRVECMGLPQREREEMLACLPKPSADGRFNAKRL